MLLQLTVFISSSWIDIIVEKSQSITFDHNAHLDFNFNLRYPPALTSAWHRKWIVVTTIQGPTPQIRKLAKLSGWRMVVVGDSKTPADWA